MKSTGEILRRAMSVALCLSLVFLNVFPVSISFAGGSERIAGVDKTFTRVVSANSAAQQNSPSTTPASLADSTSPPQSPLSLPNSVPATPLAPPQPSPVPQIQAVAQCYVTGDLTGPLFHFGCSPDHSGRTFPANAPKLGNVTELAGALGVSKDKILAVQLTQMAKWTYIVFLSVMPQSPPQPAPPNPQSPTPPEQKLEGIAVLTGVNLNPRGHPRENGPATRLLAGPDGKTLIARWSVNTDDGVNADEFDPNSGAFKKPVVVTNQALLSKLRANRIGNPNQPYYQMFAAIPGSGTFRATIFQTADSSSNEGVIPPPLQQRPPAPQPVNPVPPPGGSQDNVASSNNAGQVNGANSGSSNPLIGNIHHVGEGRSSQPADGNLGNLENFPTVSGGGNPAYNNPPDCGLPGRIGCYNPEQPSPSPAPQQVAVDWVVELGRVVDAHQLKKILEDKELGPITEIWNPNHLEDDLHGPNYTIEDLGGTRHGSWDSRWVHLTAPDSNTANNVLRVLGIPIIVRENKETMTTSGATVSSGGGSTGGRVTAFESQPASSLPSTGSSVPPSSLSRDSLTYSTQSRSRSRRAPRSPSGLA